MIPLALTHFTATSCLGHGLAPTVAALRAGTGRLQPCDFEDARLPTWIGVVDQVDQPSIEAELARFDCRNNRLARIGLNQDGFATAVRRTAQRHGPARIGVFAGTSTAGILQTELAYRRRGSEVESTANSASTNEAAPAAPLPADFHYRTTHNPFSLAEFVRCYLGLTGPATSISSACSSGAKAFASAQRMIAAGVIDAAVVAGVDSLCLTTLHGFNSLELLSSMPCRPFDVARDGISIGEGAAFALLERCPETGVAPETVLLLGVGESSDAYHMSSPHPEGLGAQMAIQHALSTAGCSAAEIDYINLHGTATPSNDRSEGAAVLNGFAATPCSSTKGATGHTLGAAGTLEAIVAVLALTQQFLPAGINTTQLDPSLPLNYILTSRDSSVRRVLSNSFGFGGTNCSLVFGRALDTDLNALRGLGGSA